MLAEIVLPLVGFVGLCRLFAPPKRSAREESRLRPKVPSALKRPNVATSVKTAAQTKA